MGCLVFIAPGGDGPTADVHGKYGMAQTPLVRFIVDLLHDKPYSKLYNKSN